MSKIEIDIPDGKSGDWSIETFVISEKDAEYHNVMSRIRGDRAHYYPGVYKRLMRGDKTIMSNTHDECNDFCWFVNEAKGKVLINGLGLGVVLKSILAKPEVTEVTVIEISSDVIKLVAPAFENDKRVTIINADAYTWKSPKGEKYDCVWHDIWDDICTDNLPLMTKLHRKYANKTKYQDSWCKSECQYLRR